MTAPDPTRLTVGQLEALAHTVLDTWIDDATVENEDFMAAVNGAADRLRTGDDNPAGVADDLDAAAFVLCALADALGLDHDLEVRRRWAKRR